MLNYRSSSFKTLALLTLLLWSYTSHAEPFYDGVSDLLGQRFSSAILLTDSDAIQFGVGSFDPNKVLHTDNDQIGSAEALDERRNRSLYLLPYTLSFNIEGSKDRHLFTSKVYALSTKTEFTLFSDTLAKDEIDELILGGSIGYGYQYYVNESVTITPKLSFNLMYYKNDFFANSALSGLIGAILDEKVFNVSAWANVYKPSVDIDYRKPVSWGRVNLTSSWNYFYGYAWGDANDGDITNPQGWYVMNQATAYYDFSGGSQTVFSGIKRVDLSKELSDELGTDHYYEATFGWLFNHPTQWDWIDNVGVGLNFNYGSSLKGGSILLFYNYE